MPDIIVQNLYNKVVRHSYNDNSKSVLDILQEQGLDWMHACGAKGRCTTCKMAVITGMENISPESAVEQKYLEQGKLAQNERLTCQCHPTGDIIIRVPQSGKMPHLKYSD